MTALEAACIFHSTLKTLAALNTPAIGIKGLSAAGGPSFGPGGKFGDGLDIDTDAKVISDASNGDMYDNGMRADKGMLEFWINTNGWNLVDGKPDAGTHKTKFSWGSGATGQFEIPFFTTVGMNWHIRWGAGGSFDAWTSTDPDLDIAASTLTHLLFYWDRTDPTEKRRVYINGVKVATDNGSWTAGDHSIEKFDLGTYRLVSGLNIDSILSNLKIYNDATNGLASASIANKENEGFPADALIIVPNFNSAREKVFFLDNFTDLNKLGYISDLEDVEENKDFQKTRMIINETVQVVNNRDNTFSPGNPKSILSGIAWEYKPFRRIDKNGVLIWDGVILDIERDNDSVEASIKSVDVLSKFQEEKVEYESTVWETPSQAALNILRALNYPEANLNLASFNTSTNIYNNNNVFIKVNFNKSDNVGLQSAFNKFKIFGCANIYMEKNQINFAAWTPFTGGIKAELNEKDFISSPEVTAPNNNLRNGYVVNYTGDGGVAAADQDNNNIGRLSRLPKRNGVREIVINGATGEQITIKDLASAVYIGECHIRRTHSNLSTAPKPLLVSTHSISINNATWLDLNTFNAMSFKREGWENKVFEISKINKNNAGKVINLTELEIAS